MPKGIVQPCAMRWSHTQRAQLNGYGPDSVLLVSTPLYSNTTLVAFLPALALGATVVIASRKLDVCAATAAEITAATGGRVVALSVDVRDPAAVAALVDGVVAATGSLPGIVVNNAAGAGRG